MESTWLFWKPLTTFLNSESLPAMVCNAYHIKNVLGVKTDGNAFWIAKKSGPGASTRVLSQTADNGNDGHDTVP